MTTRATYVLEFSEQPIGNEGYLNIDIDPKKNNGKISFSAGEEIILSIMTSSNIKESWTSSGILVAYGSTGQTITEYFPIDTKYSDTKTVSLSYLPVDPPSYSWLGIDNGNVTFDGRNVILPDSSYFGYLKVSYSYDVLFYQLKSVPQNYPEKNICIFFVNNDNIVANHIIGLVTEEEDDEDNPAVSIVVKDYVDESVVPSCVVKVDGKTVGVTDDNGYCYLGKLTKGRHELKLIPPAPYLQSDQDGLANDWFTVE